jgi:hypothetical protein
VKFCLMIIAADNPSTDLGMVAGGGAADTWATDHHVKETAKPNVALPNPLDLIPVAQA